VLKKCLCCRWWTDRRTRRTLDQLEEGAARFENAFDIRSLLKTQLDIRLLVHTLLSKRQRALFNLQRERALKVNTSKSSEEDEEGGVQEVDVSSCEELTSRATGRKEKKRNKKLAELLVGMKARSLIDRKLVLGVVQERPYRDIEKKREEAMNQNATN